MNPTVDAISARTVLRDAYVAHGNLDHAIDSNDHQRTRIAWIACLTLLRAVGHVLIKVDGERSAWIKTASGSQFNKIKDDRFGNLIFHEFIEAERNGILKEYKASIFEYEKNTNGQGQLVVRDLLVGINVYSPSGAVGEALKWWEHHLDCVETAAVEAQHLSKRNV